MFQYQHHQVFTIEKVEKKAKKMKNETDSNVSVLVETKYRESSAQTSPWQPPYIVLGKGDPELLKLDFLKWTSGLPAGIHEIRLIERARMKSAWEKETEPDIKDEKSLLRFRDYLEALERDEWAFREQEINEIQELRLHILENMLNEIHKKSKIRTKLKMQNFIEKKESEKELLLEKIRNKGMRELRKLETQRRGLTKTYKGINIIDEHIDRKSELYGPLIRHGEHPKRWHQVIDEKMKTYNAQFISVEQFNTLPTWLDNATKIKRKDLYANTKGKEVCIKESRWTAPVLKQLHDEMKNLRKEIPKQPITLRTKVEQNEKICLTPEVDEIPEADEEKYQAAVTIQKLIRGRATQIMIYEGRDTCKELIQELKYSVGLLKKQKELRKRHRLTVKTQQREECMQINMVQKLQGTLGKLQGSVVGTLLDFLNKELRRLFEERKVHAMCLINERERYIREAAEAGRRQKELRRRREHDEMFKQIVKVTQESVDVYLQDVITEGMEFASSEEAADYITRLAKKIKNETYDMYNKMSEQSVDERDEAIANMVLHFLVPDVEKKIIREKVQLQQQEHLHKVHDIIQAEFKNMPARFELHKTTDSTHSVTFDEDNSQNVMDKRFSKKTELYQIESDNQENYLVDPIEAYLRTLEQADGNVENSFNDATEEFTNKLERNLHDVNESLDTIPELSE